MPFKTGLRALGLASLVAIAAVSFHPAAASAAEPSTAVARVAAITKAQLGKAYVFGAAGPTAFDCSGLVLYVFGRAGVADRIGGGHYALGMYRWFLDRGLVSRSNPQVGDLVIYGGGGHVAIYMGGGRTISALNPSVGVIWRGVYDYHLGFTAFLHTHLSGAAVASTNSSIALASARRTSTDARTPAYVRTTASARIRAGETVRSRILAVVSSGTRLRVLGTGRMAGLRWYRVAWHGRSAWVWAGKARPTA